jgi:hypothetical protein
MSQPIDSTCRNPPYPVGDCLVRINDESVDIGYAMHPAHHWEEHVHDRHQFILMLDARSEAEIAWRMPDGSRGKRRLSGQQVCFIEKDLPHSLQWDAHAPLVCLYISEAFMTQISPDRSWKDVAHACLIRSR